MLTVTKEATVFLKVTKAAEGARENAGIRIGILRGEASNNPKKPTVGFKISDDPEPDDEELEQDGLRIFVEDVLIEALDGHILDVRYASDEPKLVLR